MKNLHRLMVLAMLVSGLGCEVPGEARGTRPGKGGSGGSAKSGASGRTGTGIDGSGGGAGANGGTVSDGGGASDSGGKTSVGGRSDTSAGGGPGGTMASSQAAGTTGKGGVSGAGSTAGGSNAQGGASARGGESGSTGSPGLTCTTCHGDSATNNPAPPSDTSGNTETTAAGVGAHAKHLAASTWHRVGKCTDCHAAHTSMTHSNDQVDFVWSSPSNADNAKPAVNTTDPKRPTCAGVYCHGVTLAGAGAVKTTPVWNQVDGSWSACGTACHALPPAASTGHPASTACEQCHGKVIASFQASSKSATWKDASLHINGIVETDALTCTSCHGTGTNPAPPKDTQGNTATTAAGVGAHAQHLGSSTWHRQGQCADCHATPTSNSHSNDKVDFSWGAPSNASGAAPSFNATALSCNGTYCHGAKMTDQANTVGRVPVWNKVDGTHDACGKACHATPPAGGSHSATTKACEKCHGDVIATFNGASSTWKNASLHINGKVESKVDCASCHGNPPNSGTHTRRDHKVACTNCHPDPNGTTHRNGTVNKTCGSSKAGCHDEGDH